MLTMAKQMTMLVLFSLLSILAAFTPSSPCSKQALSLMNEKIDDRRSFLSTIIEKSSIATCIPSVISSSYPIVANAVEEETLVPFQNTNIGFQIKVPSSWTKSEQTLPDRRKLTLFINDKEGSMGKGTEDLIFIAYTSVRDDFTSLASFGSVDQVGQATILPKGELAGQETENEMLLAESKKNSYYFDYTSKSPGQPKRHFRTIFSLIQGATGGAGSVLVTITAQTLESRYDSEMKATFDQIVDSYGKL